MTFSISKKDLIYSTVIVVLVIALTISCVTYMVKAQELSGVENSKTVDSSNSTESDSLLGVPTFESNIPHLNCSRQANYSGLPSSNTYKNDAAYATTFMTDGPSFQDINGDGLPDYSFVDHEYLTAETVLIGNFTGCVYLNNGHGWDRAYFCYARTKSDNGTILEADYRGDCADGASSKEEGMTSENSDKQ